METTEGEDSHQQKKELHDSVYQQNISYEGLFLKNENFIKICPQKLAPGSKSVS